MFCGICVEVGGFDCTYFKHQIKAIESDLAFPSMNLHTDQGHVYMVSVIPSSFKHRVDRNGIEKSRNLRGDRQREAPQVKIPRENG